MLVYTRGIKMIKVEHL